ncbi:unnamed protein product [Sympodiomycopsis kandeliae]
MASTTHASGHGPSRHTSSARSGLSGSSNLAPPSSGAPAIHRRHSLFGTEDRIILDIGSRWSKVGFSGEASPRKVFKTVEATRRPGIDAFFKESEDDQDGNDYELQKEDLLWDLNYNQGKDSSSVANKQELLLAKLTILLRTVYQEHLMTDPTQRNVILIENTFTPSIVRQHIYAILFENLRAPMVSPVSAPLLATFSAGTLTAFVVSVGVLESSILPIYHGRPLLSYFKSSNRSGRRLHHRLKALLLRYGRYIEPHQMPSSGLLQQNSTSTSGSGSLKSRTKNITSDMLTSDILDQVIIKACFVAPFNANADSGKSVSSARPPAAAYRSRPEQSFDQERPGEEQGPDWLRSHTGDHEQIQLAKNKFNSYSEQDDEVLLDNLHDKYVSAESNSPKRTGHLLLPVASARSDITEPLLLGPVSTLPPATASTSFPSAFQMSGQPPTTTPNRDNKDSPRPGGDLLIPGWLRAHVADMFFDDEGSEPDCGSASLTTLVLSGLLSLPVDLRQEMAQSILVTGGPASLPGFANRLRHECAHIMQVSQGLKDMTNGVRSGKYSHNVSLNTTRVDVHLGSLQIDDSKRRDKRQSTLYYPLKPLQSHLKVLNDHHPTLPPNGPTHPSSKEKHPPEPGTSPLLPPLLHSWFGASLLGSLRLTSIETMKREEWDAAKELEREKKIKLLQQQQQQALSPSTRGSRKSRGSYMGTAGARGIEGGAFGGLEVVARHLSLPRGNSQTSITGGGGTAPKPSGPADD